MPHENTTGPADDKHTPPPPRPEPHDIAAAGPRHRLSADPQYELPDRYHVRARALLITGFLITAAAGLLSNGVYHEDDLQHFLFARWVRHDARYLINEWGRPGFTALHALPAMAGSSATGWHACRLLSAALAAATAWLVYRTARHFNLRHAWIAPAMLYLQPLFAHLSLTTLTETPLAFYFALATWLLLTRRPVASAMVIALGPVTRHEAIILLPIWALALWQTRSRRAAYPLLFWAVAAHNLLAACWLDSLPLDVYLAPAGAAGYGHGTPLTFVPRLLLAAGPIVIALALAGVPRLAAARLGWLPTTACAVYFCVQTLVYMRGAYSSGGYARFLVPLAPWLALLATAGIEPFLADTSKALPARPLRNSCRVLAALWIMCEAEWYLNPPSVPKDWHTFFIAARIILAAGALGMLALLVHAARHSGRTHSNAFLRPFVGTLAAIILAAPMMWAIAPLRLRPQHHLTRQAVTVLTVRGLHRHPLLSVSYWPYYWAGRWIPDHPRTWQRERLETAAPGTIFIWDARRCPHEDCNLPLDDLLNDPAWRAIWASGPDADAAGPFVVLFERLGPVTTHPLR